MDCEPDVGTAAEADSASASAALADLAGLLARVAGEDEFWAAAITPGTTLEAGLGLDSVELAVLNVLLRRRHGDGVDLPGLLAALEIDQIIGLTVGDLLAHLDAVGNGGHGMPGGSQPVTQASVLLAGGCSVSDRS